MPKQKVQEMKIYIGSTGNLKHHAIMREQGWGMMHTPAWRNPVEGIKFWALDNGAYSAWMNGQIFDGDRFLKTISKIPEDNKPDFIILPDIVASGVKSLQFSMRWKKKLPGEYTYYLAVQDGIQPEDMKWEGFDGIFVGGSLKWKIRTGEMWVKEAHKEGMPCHIGKVGTFKRLFWAYRIGADSIDSSTFAQAEGARDGFQRIVDAEKEARRIGKL